MKKIGIFEETIYGERLYSYLNRNLSGDYQIYRFSHVDTYSNSGEKMDLYLMSHTFYDKMKQVDAWIQEQDVLYLTEEYEEGAHCRWDHPRRLVERIESRWRIPTGDETEFLTGEERSVIAVYSPCPMEISSWILPRMKPGSLYLGFEDIGEIREGGYLCEEEENREGRDTGELCYYVRLREEEIIRRIEDAVVSREGSYFLRSSEWYFDFVGMREEDFRWFIPKLRDSSYQKIYLGIGNAVIPSLSFFELFDHIILVDFPEQELVHRFCTRLTASLIQQGWKNPDQIECMRGRYS